MGKVRSAICLAFSSLLIAVLCFFCTVSFRVNEIETFHSTLGVTNRDITFGGKIDEGVYIGGGYSAIYYPQGVISEKEYADNLAAYEAAGNSEKVTEYKAKYPQTLKTGGLYLESEVASEDGQTVSDAFKTKIAKTIRITKERYEALHIDGMELDVVSDYALRVTLPQIYSARNYAFQNLSYTGALTVAIGASADAATTAFPENKMNASIKDYLSGFSYRTAPDGTTYVQISFTERGREIIKEKTATASSTAVTIVVKVGKESPVNFSVSQQIDQAATYISGSFTGESAAVISVLLNSALNEGAVDDLSVKYGDMLRLPATYGDNALLFVFVAFGVAILGMAAFFFARYGLLGFAYLFTYLLFLFSLLLCIWAIPFLYLSVSTILGLLLASAVLAISSALPYEYARKEFAAGRTMSSCVKSAYKSTFWHVFDLHVVLAALAFIVYGISFAGLATFAFTFGLGIGFSALCSVLVGRLQWACMMAFTTKKGSFCRFKREEVEEDD